MPLVLVLWLTFATGLLAGPVLPPSPIDRKTFLEHVRLHVNGVDRITRVWWALNGKGGHARHLDFLVELSRGHDVSKWGARWRFDDRFKKEFDRLGETLDSFHGRTKPREVTTGSDLLTDLVGVNFNDPDLDPEVRKCGEAVRVLMNRIDAEATAELLAQPGYERLSARDRARLLGAVSLSDITHRYLASNGSGLAFGRIWQTATRLEFGRPLRSGSSFLMLLGEQRKPVPGIPEDLAAYLPIEEAIRQIQELETDPRVLDIAAHTSLPVVPPSCPLVFAK